MPGWSVRLCLLTPHPCRGAGRGVSALNQQKAGRRKIPFLLPSPPCGDTPSTWAALHRDCRWEFVKNTFVFLQP